MTALHELLRDSFASCSTEIDEFQRLQAVVAGVRLDTFFEPASLIEVTEGVGSLVSPDSATMTGWAAHVSNGTRVRMRTLENALLEQLAYKRMLPAMVLARSHMEAAAPGSVCLRRCN